MHKIFFPLILFCCCISVTHAQEPVLKDSLEEADEELMVLEEPDILSDTGIYITPIHISPDSVAAWKSNKRFAYIMNLDSLLKVKQQEELDAYNKRLKEKPGKFLIFLGRLFSSGILPAIFWTIAILFVVFILYKLFFSTGIFRRNSARSKSTVNELPVEERIATVSDYDNLIHQSVKLGDYRMAVRYLFLKCLVHLADKEYVHYSADKTNYQYVQEIPADKKNEFASLVLNYEYIWYGNFLLGAESFAGIEKKFSSFYTKIQ